MKAEPKSKKLAILHVPAAATLEQAAKLCSAHFQVDAPADWRALKIQAVAAGFRVVAKDQ